jgi:hypothetical protein
VGIAAVISSAKKVVDLVKAAEGLVPYNEPASELQDINTELMTPQQALTED